MGEFYSTNSPSESILAAPSSGLSSSSISVRASIKSTSCWSTVGTWTKLSFCPAKRTARVTGFYLLIWTASSSTSISKFSFSASCMAPIILPSQSSNLLLIAPATSHVQSHLHCSGHQGDQSGLGHQGECLWIDGYYIWDSVSSCHFPNAQFWCSGQPVIRK